jgi:hypothetical protein
MHDVVYNGQRFCANDDTYRAGGTLCRIPREKLFWTLEGGLPSIDGPTLKQAYADAWRLITDVCGLTVEYTSNPKKADVLTRFGPIDGPANVLAWSKIWCGNNGPVDQLFDTSEAFVYSTNPPSNRLSLVGVACHENIHACGLNGHIGRGNLMAPTYDSRILVPQAGDIAELVSRYGLPKPAAPPTTPIPPRDTVIGPRLEFVDADGRRWRLNGAWEEV